MDSSHLLYRKWCGLASLSSAVFLLTQMLPALLLPSFFCSSPLPSHLLRLLRGGWVVWGKKKKETRNTRWSDVFSPVSSIDKQTKRTELRKNLFTSTQAFSDNDALNCLLFFFFISVFNLCQHPYYDPIGQEGAGLSFVSLSFTKN